MHACSPYSPRASSTRRKQHAEPPPRIRRWPWPSLRRTRLCSPTSHRPSSRRSGRQGAHRCETPSRPGRSPRPASSGDPRLEFAVRVVAYNVAVESGDAAVAAHSLARIRATARVSRRAAAPVDRRALRHIRRNDGRAARRGRGPRVGQPGARDRHRGPRRLHAVRGPVLRHRYLRGQGMGSFFRSSSRPPGRTPVLLPSSSPMRSSAPSSAAGTRRARSSKMASPADSRTSPRTTSG